MPADTVLLVSLDGRVPSRVAHMVMASAVTRVSEVMRVDRFSVGEHPRRGDTGFSCMCHEPSPKLHRSRIDREGRHVQVA